MDISSLCAAPPIPPAHIIAPHFLINNWLKVIWDGNLCGIDKGWEEKLRFSAQLENFAVAVDVVDGDVKSVAHSINPHVNLLLFLAHSIHSLCKLKFRFSLLRGEEKRWSESEGSKFSLTIPPRESKEISSTFRLFNSRLLPEKTCKQRSVFFVSLLYCLFFTPISFFAL